MSFWWVNHKQTRDHEIRGGYLWSPYRKANGAFNQTYENMRHVQVGDTVFSYGSGQIAYVGTVTSAAVPGPKPEEFGNVGDNWADDGWLVDVYFQPVTQPLRPTDHLQQIGPLFPDKHSPIQKATGHGNQGCYLAAISDALGHILLALLKVDLEPRFQHRVSEPAPAPKLLEDLQVIEHDPNLLETQRLHLTKARVGQGLYRKRVMLLESTCRVTGVEDSRLLIASHIKPWRASNNIERLDGHNGILLSPHVDALFDDHLMTFEDNGCMRFHQSLSLEVLERWGVDPQKKLAPFRPEQALFLEHHRASFKQKIL